MSLPKHHPFLLGIAYALVLLPPLGVVSLGKLNNTYFVLGWMLYSNGTWYILCCSRSLRWVSPHAPSPPPPPIPAHSPIHASTHLYTNPFNHYALPLTILVLTDCRGAKALLVVQQVLQQSSMQELALFSLLASPKQKQLKIRLDKVGQPCRLCICCCANNCSTTEQVPHVQWSMVLLHQLIKAWSLVIISATLFCSCTVMLDIVRLAMRKKDMVVLHVLQPVTTLQA